MLKIKLLCVTLFSFSVFAITTVYAQPTTLKSMSDEQLSETTGQALMSLSYIAPTDATNLEAKRSGGDKNIGFYKLGLEAALELNVNIKKLQLGCGGVNGAGNCDIDIDNLGLSGLGNSATSNTDSASDRAARVGSSAVLTNPFIQFAIKNPESASTRQVVGLNLSSEKATGLMTFGLENAVDAFNNGIPNGINSLSGYMLIAQQTGKATINPITITQNGANNATGVVLAGKACSTGLFGGCGIIRTTYTTTSYDITLTPTSQATLTLPQQPIEGKRMNSALLTASTTVNNIQLSGQLAADTTLLGIKISGNTSGVLNNLKVNATIDESLGLFHKATLNGTPVLLSTQFQDIKWPGAQSVAQKGWWLEISNPIDIGDITPNKNIDIAMPTIKEALGEVNNFLADNWVYCGSLALSCLTGNIPLGTANLPNNASPVDMAMKNLSLKNQNFTPNCYGSLKFC
ncbi:hypothetical protein [Acinetobacter guillouiae]|uniref:hypothetical protein n=1 Tax=Acinetobacter guillouiae TaxID=106649 RepID=UPI003AF44A19